jgi:hypothetical protein
LTLKIADYIGKRVPPVPLQSKTAKDAKNADGFGKMANGRWKTGSRFQPSAFKPVAISKS